MTQVHHYHLPCNFVSFNHEKCTAVTQHAQEKPVQFFVNFSTTAEDVSTSQILQHLPVKFILFMGVFLVLAQKSANSESSSQCCKKCKNWESAHKK